MKWREAGWKAETGIGDCHADAFQNGKTERGGQGVAERSLLALFNIITFPRKRNYVK
jgi:hypothetical protein